MLAYKHNNYRMNYLNDKENEMIKNETNEVVRYTISENVYRDMIADAKNAELESLLNSKKLYDELRDEYDYLVLVLKRFKDQIEKRELQQITNSIKIAEDLGFHGNKRPHACLCSYKARGEDACVCGGREDVPDEGKMLDLSALRDIDTNYLELLDQYERASKVLRNFALRMKDVTSIEKLRGLED